MARGLSNLAARSRGSVTVRSLDPSGSSSLEIVGSKPLSSFAEVPVATTKGKKGRLNSIVGWIRHEHPNGWIIYLSCYHPAAFEPPSWPSS